MATSGAYCAGGQSGPVWFLVDYGATGSVVRTCTVPAGKALLISPAWDECSMLEGDAKTDEGLRDCVASTDLEHNLTEVHVTVDGVPITNLVTHYRLSVLFTFAYPVDNVRGVYVPRPGTSRAAGEGIFVMLAPLAVGPHTLDLGFHGWGMTSHVTYHLTIRG